jgi:perosamine synthetase
MRLRQQLPAYSPFALRHLLHAARANGDVAADVRRLLLSEYAADDVLICGSGTQALQLALQLAQQEMASPVVALPGYGCYDLASAAIGARSRVCLYDLDPATLGPDMDSVHAAIAAGARTIVAAPLYGVPVDWAALSSLAEREGCLLIEDAAQGHGAFWKGLPLGALGTFSVISFGRGKGWTCGGGGALLLRGRSIPPDLALERGGNALRRTAMLLAQWALGRPSIYGIPAGMPALGLGQTVYHEPRAPQHAPGRALALLMATHGSALAEAAQRRHNAATLQSIARVAGLATFEGPPESTPGYIRFPVRIGADAQTLAASQNARSLGVAAGYPTTLADLQVLADHLATQRPQVPGADTLVHSLITLPTHSRVTCSDMERLQHLLHEIPRPDRPEPTNR